MPLESLPDRFGDVHEELDKAVNEATLYLEDVPNAAFVLSFLHLLLHYIVHRSNGELDPKYLLHEESKRLIEAHQELRDLLVSA